MGHIRTLLDYFRAEIIAVGAAIYTWIIGLLTADPFIATQRFFSIGTSAVAFLCVVLRALQLIRTTPPRIEPMIGDG